SNGLPGDWNAIYSHGFDANATIAIDHATIRYGGWPVAGGENTLVGNFNDSSSLSVTNSNLEFTPPGMYAVRNASAAPPADARFNWWGNPSGPRRDDQACPPIAASGSKVSCNVDFGSFLSSPASVPPPTIDPKPAILLIHGWNSSC